MNTKLKNITNENASSLFVCSLLVILIVIFIYKNYGNLKEAYTNFCQVQAQGNNGIDCYHRRLTSGIYRTNVERGNYYNNELLLRRPDVYNDSNTTHRIGLLAFYLNYREHFPRIGCGSGWINKIGGTENDVISEWGYYFFRIMTDPDARNQIKHHGSNTDTLHFQMNSLLHYNNDQEIRNFKNFIRSDASIIAIYNTLKDAHPVGFQRNMYEVLINTFLCHYLLNRTRTGYNAFYRWGVPSYRDMVIDRGSLVVGPLHGNSESFNYWYNISYGDGTTRYFLGYDRDSTSTESKYKFITMNTNDANDLNTAKTDGRYLFRLEYSTSCGHFFKIRNKNSGQYLNLEEYNQNSNKDANVSNHSVGDTATSFFIDYKHIENDFTNDDLYIDITKILIPLASGQENNISACTLPIGKTARIFKSSLTRGKKVVSACFDNSLVTETLQTLFCWQYFDYRISSRCNEDSAGIR